MPLQTGASLSAALKAYPLSFMIHIFKVLWLDRSPYPPQSIQYNSEEPHFPQLRSCNCVFLWAGNVVLP